MQVLVQGLHEDQEENPAFSSEGDGEENSQAIACNTWKDRSEKGNE